MWCCFQAYTLLDRALSVPYYARFQWHERRIRREFAAGLVYESEDGTRIEAPSWAQIEARLGSGHELMDVEAVLTTADGSYMKAWGGPQAYHVEVGLYTADGGLRRFRANGSQVPERGYTTIDGTTVYLLAGNRMPNYVVPSLFRSFMEEEFPPKGIRWVEVSTLNDKVTANAPYCIMSPAEVDLAQKAVALLDRVMGDDRQSMP